jgi:hypothetical protein
MSQAGAVTMKAMVQRLRSPRPRRPFGGFSKPSLLRTIGKLMIDC